VATTDKDFVVKNGLVVQGAQGTIDGEVIVTEASLGTSLGGYIASSEKGSIDGVATLDENGQVPAEQLGNAGAGGADFTITDALLGETLYVGDTTPSTPAEGDIWIDESSVTGAITWGQLKALEGIASGG
jgi:hypothetical protein